MRKPFLAAVSAFALMAQTPLMTAPRPEDTPTTEAVPLTPGPEGAAPSDDRQAPPLSRSPSRSLTTAEAKALLGRPVTTTDGQTGGEIRDFVLGGPDGRVEQVVIGSGGFLGIGEKLVAIPAEKVGIAPPPVLPDGRPAPAAAVSVALSAADLKAAPEFLYTEGTRAMLGPRAR